MGNVVNSLLLLAIFGTVILVAYYFAPKFRQYSRRSKHLVMVTLNSQHRIEWMIWSYRFWQDYTEPKGSITCVDVGSQDDTLKILERLHYRCPQLQIVALDPHADTDKAFQDWLAAQNISKDRLVVLDLREFANDVEMATDQKAQELA